MAMGAYFFFGNYNAHSKNRWYWGCSYYTGIDNCKKACFDVVWKLGHIYIFQLKNSIFFGMHAPKNDQRIKNKCSVTPSTKRATLNKVSGHFIEANAACCLEQPSHACQYHVNLKKNIILVPRANFAEVVFFYEY